MLNKIPAGTRFFLAKKRAQTLYIRPDTVLKNDNLYVAYDVRVNGTTMIPKGTRVVGDWVTESNPIAAQLQIHQIYLQREGQNICADSDVIENISLFNDNEINNADHLARLSRYRSTANTLRRVVDINCDVKTLTDVRLNTIYLEILTKEIPVTLLADFMPFS